MDGRPASRGHRAGPPGVGGVALLSGQGSSRCGASDTDSRASGSSPGAHRSGGADGSVLQVALSLVLAHIANTALLGRSLFFVATRTSTVVGAGFPSLMLRSASTPLACPVREVGWLWRHSMELSLVFGLAADVCWMTGNGFLEMSGWPSRGSSCSGSPAPVLKAACHPSVGVLLDIAVYPLS